MPLADKMYQMRCRSTKFPGRLIYEKDDIKIFEVDGRDHKVREQNGELIRSLTDVFAKAFLPEPLPHFKNVSGNQDLVL